MAGGNPEHTTQKAIIRKALPLFGGREAFIITSKYIKNMVDNNIWSLVSNTQSFIGESVGVSRANFYPILKRNHAI